MLFFSHCDISPHICDFDKNLDVIFVCQSLNTMTIISPLPLHLEVFSRLPCRQTDTESNFPKNLSIKNDENIYLSDGKHVTIILKRKKMNVNIDNILKGKVRLLENRLT